jgi:4-alpha-glucanotransferase
MTGEELLNSPEFELFYKEHSFWLAPYSIFCHLRDRYKTANFRLWAHFSTYNYQEVKLFSERDDDCKNDVKISLFVQYHLYKQLINFNLEIISDNLIKNGLLIESPRENMRYIPKINAKKTQFYKLLKNSDQEAFDILYNHYYYHNNERLWSESGFLKLQEILSFTQMLACAEDLGMIPACVPKVLRHFRTLTLEIQRFTKEGDQKYANPSQYPYFSICTTGTHDTSTLRGWLNEVGEEEIQEELRHALKKETKTSNKREILRELLRINLDSPSFAAIFPLQDWFTLSDTLSQRDPDQERINIPADPDHIWNYRMHKTIEEVTCDNLFKNSLKTIIADSGRRSQI